MILCSKNGGLNTRDITITCYRIVNWKYSGSIRLYGDGVWSKVAGPSWLLCFPYYDSLLLSKGGQAVEVQLK